MAAFRASFCCFVAPLALVACSATQAYEGSALPDTQVAVLVPDNPGQRNLGSPLEPNMSSGRVSVKVAGVAPRGFSDRLSVPAGRHELEVSFRDRNTPVAARELYTDPVLFPVTVQGGREYRVRGGVLYPPARSRYTRTLDTRQYRVIFALEDMASGQIVSRVQVPPAQIKFDGG